MPLETDNTIAASQLLGLIHTTLPITSTCANHAHI